MKLMVFSSNMDHLNKEIENLTHLANEKKLIYETYNTNSLLGMQKAVQLNVFGSFQSVLIDDLGQIKKRFDQKIPTLNEI